MKNMIKKMLWSMVLKVIYWLHTTITSAEVLKGWGTVIRKQFKKLQSFLNLIRVTRTGRSVEHKDEHKQENWTNFETMWKKRRKLKTLSYKSFQKTARNRLMLGTNS